MAPVIRKKGFGYGDDKVDVTTNQNAWQLIIDTAEKYNQPGVFCAFIGYEWSVFAGDPTIHLHRNVIFRSNKVPELAYETGVPMGGQLNKPGEKDRPSFLVIAMEDPEGANLDITTATYTNSIGATTLATVWQDPEFNPAQEAFYYVRVLEIPTPRWSTFDAIALGKPPMDPATIQERAVTSAIWYNPDN